MKYEPNVFQKGAEISGCSIEYRDGDKHTWLVYFCRSDAGRSESKRPRQKNDCTVRALALAMGWDYDRTYDLLKSAGRESHRGMQFRQWADKQSFLKWRAFQAVKGETRMNPAKFCEQFNTGAWIARTAKHVFAVVNGVVYDMSSPDPARCIYGAWEVLS